MDEAKNPDEGALQRGFLTKYTTKRAIHKTRKLLFYYH
jgi:hypothetical protein